MLAAKNEIMYLKNLHDRDSLWIDRKNSTGCKGIAS